MIFIPNGTTVQKAKRIGQLKQFRRTAERYGDNSWNCKVSELKAPQSSDDSYETPSTPSRAYGTTVDATGHIFIGVKLYFGPEKIYIGKVTNTDNSYYDSFTGETYRAVEIEHPDGNRDWKPRSDINLGQWYVEEDDPALPSGY